MMMRRGAAFREEGMENHGDAFLLLKEERRRRWARVGQDAEKR